MYFTDGDNKEDDDDDDDGEDYMPQHVPAYPSVQTSYIFQSTTNLNKVVADPFNGSLPPTGEIN